jgi:hypothetical protein
MSRITCIVALALVLALALAPGCGSKTPAPADPEKAEPAEPAEPTEPVAEPFTCVDACTEYAVCYEEMNGDGAFSEGGACVSSCFEDEDQESYFACIRSEDCTAMFDCLRERG